MPKGVYPRKPRPLKHYPAELVDAISHRYLKHGMSQVETAVDLGLTLKVVYRVMLNHAIPRRPQIKRNQRGACNHMWKGADATYTAFHCRLTNRPDQPTCCQWCGVSDRRLEWANLTGRYADESDYARLCKSCHARYDAQRRRETGELTSPRRGGDANAT